MSDFQSHRYLSAYITKNGDSEIILPQYFFFLIVTTLTTKKRKLSLPTNSNSPEVHTVFSDCCAVI